jgi:hypothetical protein
MTVRGLARSACVLALVLVVAACVPPYPGEDEFYTPPAPLPAVQAGSILRSRPSAFTLDPVSRKPVPGVASQQILYASTDVAGQAIAVSGTVLVPTSRWIGPGSRPLITYGVGTRGIGDDCAPSYTLSQGADYEGLFIKALLDRGWAVVVSDYAGLGTPGLHPYLVGKAQGRALLDAARAALRSSETGLTSSSPVGIMGYSQGGQSAGWAAQLAPSYAPELKVKGTVAGGVPGDLLATAKADDGGPFVAMALWAAIGYDAAYPELDLERYLNDRGRAFVADATEPGGGCVVSVDGIKSLLGSAFTSTSDYATPSPLDLPAWQARLGEQKLGTVKPSAPVFQYHALTDEMVPFGQAATLRRAWCSKGATVDWMILPGEHLLGLIEGVPLGVTWMGQRFAGLPTFGNCLLP